MSKTGNWYSTNKQRERTNNSVILIRSLVQKEEFERLVRLNDGMNDIGFVFANSWFDMFNPCFEISKLPIYYFGDLSKIHYLDIQEFTKVNEHLFGVQGCNLNEIVAEKCTTLEKFLRYCFDSAVIGTCQAGYTYMPYLGEISQKIFEREALLGISIIGWMNNPKLFNAEWLQKGAKVVKETNELIAKIIGINPAARTTCVKPGGNSSVVAMTVGGMSAEEAGNYFRVMQINKENTVAKWLAENMPFMIEESVHSDSKTDYVVFVPITVPKGAILKNDILGVKHLELIKLVQENWVMPGTNEDLCAYKGINHNVSCTVNFEGDKTDMIEYIWENKQDFTAISFLSNYGSRGWNQAPLTELVPMEDIVQKYGTGAVFASGLIVDGLHYFQDDLWKACAAVLDKNIPVTGNREQVLLKKYWLDRAKKFAKNYFKGDVEKMVLCLKDIHILHKWESINKKFKSVDLSKILTKPEYKEVSDFAAMACSGGACSIQDRIK
jgi:ribonucleoside-triphosphate reductase